MAYEAHVEGAPTEEVVRRLIEEARAAGADVVEIETTHEDGDAWIRAGFTETARVLQAPLAALEQHLGARKRAVVRLASTCRPTTSTRSSGPCASSSRGFPADRREARCFRPATAGPRPTTS